MPSREITLEEAARSFGTRHRAYKEYCSLLGKSIILESLEKSIHDICIQYSNESKSGRLPPELELMSTLISLNERVEELESKSRNPIGAD